MIKASERDLELPPLGQLVQAVNAEMKAALGYRDGETDDFLRMPSYHLGWEDYGERSAVSGKAVRPLLTLLSTIATGGDWEKALPFAAAVELVHSFSLVHDDIQDGSDTRRGRPSVWAKWGEAHGINVGDSLFAFAHLAANRDSGLPPQAVLAALRVIDSACVALSRGQYLDLSFETREDIAVLDYMQMIYGKTASLLGAACELGGIASGVDQGVLDALRTFGLHVGIAFQVRDDLLGIWGDPDLTGKPSEDISGKKKTLPLLIGRQRSEVIGSLLAGNDEIDVEEVIGLLEAVDAVSDTEAEMRRYAHTAVEALRGAAPPCAAKDQLMAIALQAADISGLNRSRRVTSRWEAASAA